MEMAAEPVKLGYSIGGGNNSGLFAGVDGDHVTTLMSSAMPIEGYWEWKDNSTGLKYVPHSHLEKSRNKSLRGGGGTGGTGGGGFTGKDALVEMMRKQGIRIPGQPIAMPNLSRKETTVESDQKVTLDNVKEVALMQSEVSLTAEFSHLINSHAFHTFLVSLLRYFNEYLKIVEIDNQPRGMVAEMSAVERKAREEASRNLHSSEKTLGFNYSILILGLELPELHHMECGRSRVSALHKDRALFEKMYHFCAYVVWICFKRPNMDSVKKEMGRILKSDHFNSYARTHAAAGHTTFMDRARMSETSYLRATAEANKARKDLVKKAPIKSIVGEKSPVLRSLLPSTKEQSLWLFDKIDVETLRRKELETQGDDSQHKRGHHFKSRDLGDEKLGIIGESLKKFNSTTLIPVDKEKKGEKDKEETLDQTDVKTEMNNSHDHELDHNQTES